MVVEGTLLVSGGVNFELYAKPLGDCWCHLVVEFITHVFVYMFP